MTTQTEVLKSETALSGTPGNLLARALAEIVKTDPKAAAELAADSYLSAIAKAHSLLEAGDDEEKIGQVEDQWDGPPDDHVEVVRVTGAVSKVPPGKVGTGPGQEASGDGAAEMQRSYSRHTPQKGVQLATERLGRDIMRKAISALLPIIEAQGMQFNLLKSSIQTPEQIEAIVAAAITKAMPEVIKGIVVPTSVTQTPVVKAEDEHEEKEEKHEKPEFKIGEKEEDDDEDEAKKARTLVTLAGNELLKASQFELNGKKKKAAAAHGEAVKALREAEPLMKAADKPTQKAYKRLVAKALPEGTNQAENQELWPISDPERVGKSGQVPDMTALATAASQIQKAAEGLGMLTANVQQVMSAIGNQSKTPGGLPPVFALAKASPADTEQRMVKIASLVEAGEITSDDADLARDAVQRLQMSSMGTGMPVAWAQQAITRLHPKIQAILAA